MSYLKCPVCNSKLEKVGNAYVCNNKHSFDISKKGYTNLMLANQGHSLEEGDKKDMVVARSNFLDSDKYQILKNTLINIISAITGKELSFVDVACGEGYYTNAIHKELQLKKKDIVTYGIDISKPAINHACTRKNIDKLVGIAYFVGNMDYLPFLNNSFDVLLNCFAPINEKEFIRVLKEDGYYIRVLPGEYHLYELKEFLYDEVHLNIPKEENLEGFTLIDDIEASDVIELNNEQIQNLFTMTPYYYKTSMEAKERLKKLDYLKTRISFSIRVYKAK